jgi:hypothetical protein
MKLNFKRYVIVTNERPTEFLAEAENQRGRTNGELTDDLEEALLFNSDNEAGATLQTLDNPSEFFIMPINIRYEF